MSRRVPSRPHPGVLPLRDAADRRSLAFLALLAALDAVQWTGWLRHWALWPPTALLAFVACVVKHNHVHCRTFTVRGLNLALDQVLGLLTGHPTTAIITAHNHRHHGRHQTPEDWVRCSLVGFRWNWLNFLAFAPVAVWRMRRSRPSDLARWRRERPRLFRRAVAERLVLYAAIGALLAADWRATLVYLVGPWLAAQWALVTINLLQHQGCDPASEVDHSRNVTGRLVNWLLLNNGFHAAHHMHPALHWSRLPAYHRHHVAPRVRRGLEERSFARALWRQLLAPPSAGVAVR